MDSRKSSDIATQIINRKDPKTGESLLFVAAKAGDIEHVKLLLQYPGMDMDATRTPGDGKTASEIAEENGHKSIACLIRLQQLERRHPEMHLQLMNDPCIQKMLNSADQHAEVKTDEEAPFPFWQYANALRHIPDEKLLIKFLKETADRLSQNMPLTASVKKQVEARKTWTDIVSAFYQKYHPADPKMEQKDDNFNLEKIKAGVIARLAKLGYTEKTETIYHQCLYFLRYHSVIVISINTSFLKKESLSIYQLLTLFQTGKNAEQGASKPYRNSREETEKQLFQDLLPDFEGRPRYGSLRLLDRNNVVEGNTGYGKSLVVLHGRIKFNALFSPRDTHNARAVDKKIVRLCTYHNLEVLLSQSTDERLKAIAHRVTTGILPQNYKQYESYQVRPEEYIEVLLPAVNLLDPNMVQHIHIEPADYTLTGEDWAAFAKIGITVTNSKENPYKTHCALFMQAVETNDLDTAEKLLKDYPSLGRTTNRLGHHPVHIAAAKGDLDLVELLVENGADINAVTPEYKTPLHYAIENRHKNVVEKILNMPRVKSITQLDGNGTLLTTAVEKSDVAITAVILHKYKNDLSLSRKKIEMVNYKNENGESALFIAASLGDVEKIKCLLNFPGIDLEAKRLPGDGKTALQIAGEKNHLAVAALIREAQARWMIKFTDYILGKKNFDDILPAEKANLDRFIRMASENYFYEDFELIVKNLEARGLAKRNIADVLKNVWPVNIKNLMLVLAPAELAVCCGKDRNLFLDFIVAAREARLKTSDFQAFISEALPYISRLLQTLKEAEICAFLSKLRDALLKKMSSSHEEMKSEQSSCPLDVLLLLKDAPFLDRCLLFIATLSTDEINFLFDVKNADHVNQVVKLGYQVVSIDQKRALLKFCLGQGSVFSTKIKVEDQIKFISHVFTQIEIKNNIPANQCLQQLKEYMKTATGPKRIWQVASAMYELTNDPIDDDQIRAISAAIKGNTFLGNSTPAGYLDEYLGRKRVLAPALLKQKGTP
ncbi:MAG TPA: ankyrin repeat domain-containing protein [Gammaproteobacteria bacterium]|nr:ankyrin repeat domain-containing protein [Gammaproteobacteria bacterium]